MHGPDPMRLHRRDKRCSPPKSFCQACRRPSWTYDLQFCRKCSELRAEFPDIPLEDLPGRATTTRQERPTDTDWKRQAACKHADPQRFAAPEDDHVTNYVYRQYRETAREYCDGCPVRLECGQEATDMHYEGLFGGELRVLNDEGVPRMVRFTHRGGAGVRWVELAKASS